VTDDTNSNLTDNLDLDAAIGAAEELAGAVDDGMGANLDDVLNADSNDEGIEGGPRRYDFNRPHNISRNFEQNLQAVGETFAKTGTIDFTSLLRMSAAVEYSGLRQCTFAEYMEEIPSPTCIAMVTMPPFKGYSLVHIDLGLSFVFLKKMMGGSPEPEDSVREFTEIERGINAGLVDRFTEIFRKAVSKWVAVEPSFSSLENNPNYISGIPDGESMIIMNFLLKLDTVEAPVQLGFPMSAFGPVKEIFDPKITSEMRTPSELKGDRNHILEMVQGTPGEMVVELGTIASNLEEILNLSVGDVLQLGHGVNTPLTVNIAGEKSWFGEAGRIGQNRAIKLIQQLEKE
jgi:flagellar motor switch protein FliM